MRIQSRRLVLPCQVLCKPPFNTVKVAKPILTVAQKVLASGANAAFSNRASPDEQAAEVKSITGGKVGLVWDSSGQAHEAGFKILAESTAQAKYFSTTDNV